MVFSRAVVNSFALQMETFSGESCESHDGMTGMIWGHMGQHRDDIMDDMTWGEHGNNLS